MMTEEERRERIPISLNDIVKAEARIHGYAIHTPTYSCFSEELVSLKLECFQPVRSFKIRGAANKIFSLAEEQLKRGVITASSGNHGLAVAYVASKIKINVTIVLPENAVPEKLEMIRSLGANTVFAGRQQDERVRKANEICEAERLSFIQPFNDLEIITGQATCGMELIEDDPEIESVFVPIGGGGLISGIACAARLLEKPGHHIKVIGVQSEGSPSMYKSFVNRTLSSIEESKTIADGLAVRKPGDITFSIVRRYVDDIILVSDEDIINATAHLLKREHILSEPSGAAAFAGLLKLRKETGGKKHKSAAIVSGANISSEMLSKVVAR